jgi:hypothetical protein
MTCRVFVDEVDNVGVDHVGVDHDERSSDICDSTAAGGEKDIKVKEKVKEKESGNVRMYQLGLKSQKSIGRICGPRLRSFEGGN